MRLLQAALDTCLESPLLASLSVHGLHFTVYAPTIFAIFLGTYTGVLQERLRGAEKNEKFRATFWDSKLL